MIGGKFHIQYTRRKITMYIFINFYTRIFSMLDDNIFFTFFVLKKFIFTSLGKNRQ